MAITYQEIPIPDGVSELAFSVPAPDIYVGCEVIALPDWTEQLSMAQVKISGDNGIGTAYFTGSDSIPDQHVLRVTRDTPVYDHTEIIDRIVSLENGTVGDIQPQINDLDAAVNAMNKCLTALYKTICKSS